MEVYVLLLIAVGTTSTQYITNQSYSNISIVPLFSTETAAFSNESVPAFSNESITAFNNENVPAFSNESVTAFSNESVPAFSNESITTFSNENVPAFSNENVPAFSNENVPAFSNESVAAFNNENVPAFNNESVTAFSNESVDVAKSGEEVAVFLFAGDISLDKPVRQGNGSACLYESILANVTEYFKGVDYNMINLESPFVTKELAGKSFLPDKGIHNMAWREGVRTLTSAGIKSVTIANNHITDYGSEGLRFTEEVLESHGIEVAGVTTGSSPPYSNQIPIIKTFNGVKVGILAYCADTSAECLRYRPQVDRGPALMYRETAEKDIANLRARVNVIVLYLHWGREYMSIPGEEQRQLAVYLSGLGVNLIVGTHPHVLQGHEWINDTLVHYSLGNFVFHPHFTMMRNIGAFQKRTGIKKKMVEQSLYSRGPTGFTELFKVEIIPTGIREAYYLPTKIQIRKKYGCPYPEVRRQGWLKLCGPEDNNCYAPRYQATVYLDKYDDSED